VNSSNLIKEIANQKYGTWLRAIIGPKQLPIRGLPASPQSSYFNGDSFPVAVGSQNKFRPEVNKHFLRPTTFR
jgi:hypothetical protein